MAGNSHTPLFFLSLRYIGMSLIAVSTIFLLQKTSSPIINILDFHVANGPMGNLLLSAGAVLFGVYLIQRVYSYFKSR